MQLAGKFGVAELRMGLKCDTHYGHMWEVRYRHIFILVKWCDDIFFHSRKSTNNDNGHCQDVWEFLLVWFGSYLTQSKGES